MSGSSRAGLRATILRNRRIDNFGRKYCCRRARMFRATRRRAAMLRAAPAAGCVARAAKRLAVDGASLRRLLLVLVPLFLLLGLRGRLAGRCQPHHQGLQLRQQVRAPVPQQAPQGPGAGNAVPQEAQPAQPGRMVPRKVGRVLRAVAVADGRQQVDGQQAGQGVDPAPVVRNGLQVGHQAADGRFEEAVGVWDHGGHEGCNASLWVHKHEDAGRPSLCRGRSRGSNHRFGSYVVNYEFMAERMS